MLRLLLGTGSIAKGRGEAKAADSPSRLSFLLAAPGVYRRRRRAAARLSRSSCSVSHSFSVWNAEDGGRVSKQA